MLGSVGFQPIASFFRNIISDNPDLPSLGPDGNYLPMPDEEYNRHLDEVKYRDQIQKKIKM